MPQAPFNMGAKLSYVAAGGGTAVAAGTGDNTAVDSGVLDMLNIDSAELVIVYRTTLTADKTLSFTVTYDTNTSNTVADASTHGLYTKAVVKTGAATAYDGVLEVASLDFRHADYDDRYWKFQITPDLSHTSSDTVQWTAFLVYTPKSI